MGFWNDGFTAPSSSTHTRRRSRSRSSSPSRRRRSSHRGDSPQRVYTRESSSFFGLPNTSSVSQARSTSSRHGGSEKRYYATRSSSGSVYSSGSRRGFTNRMYHRLRRFLRDLYYYMRRHPVKVFMLVILPLLTGGALTKILATFGVRLPRGIDELVGGAGGARGAGGYERERYYARGGARDYEGGMNLPGMGSGGLGGMAGNVQGLLKVAKMFM